MGNDRLLEMQEMLFQEMKRLSNDKLMKENGMYEIARSNSLSASALTIIKSINVQLRIQEIAEKQQLTSNAIQKRIGVENETK